MLGLGDEQGQRLTTAQRRMVEYDKVCKGFVSRVPDLHRDHAWFRRRRTGIQHPSISERMLETWGS